MLETVGRVWIQENLTEKYKKIKLPGRKIEKCWYIKVLGYNRIWKVAYLLGFNNNIGCIETNENDEVFGYQEGLITT